MNLEIASRLVALRKENNLSQEALAEKLGISRQAVSKWERAEASPDTDNLIALAKLYHVSLDELLKIHEADEEESVKEPYEKNEICIAREDVAEPGRDNEQSTDYNGQEAGQTETDDTGEDVHIGFDGIHVKDKTGEVLVSWKGIHVHDKEDGNVVDIDKNGVRVNGEDARGHLFAMGKETELPLGIIAIIVYIILGVCFNWWHPGWLIFLLVPVVSTLIDAVRRHNPNLFAYPVLALVIFLYVGIVYHIWHPTWVVFLTIPVYYSIAGYFVRHYTKDTGEEAENSEY